MYSVGMDYVLHPLVNVSLYVLHVSVRCSHSITSYLCTLVPLYPLDSQYSPYLGTSSLTPNPVGPIRRGGKAQPQQFTPIRLVLLLL